MKQFNQVGWPGCYINVRRYGALSMALLQLKASFELFMNRIEFLPGTLFLSCQDLTLSC